MNNDPEQPGWPDVPAAIPSWHFYSSIRSCQRDWGANEDYRTMHRLSRRTLLVQLKLMANTQCNACSGYGHRARDCPTNLRLGMLSSSTNEWKNIIAWARAEVLLMANEGRGDKIQRPSYHSIPTCLGRKRTHASAFRLK